MTQRYVLHLTRSRMIATLLPVATAAWLSRSPFVIGGVSSLIALILVQSVWGWRDARREKRERLKSTEDRSVPA